MHVTHLDPLHHHRTLPVLVAAAVALALAIAAFVVVERLTSSGTRAPDTRPPAAASSGQGVDGTFLDPVVFEQALAEATATLTPGAVSAAPTGGAAGTAPSIIEHPGAFDTALGEVSRELGLTEP